MGRLLGYSTYTVDQSKTFNGKRLGDVAVLKEIPPFAGELNIGAAREIDVIWFGDDENPKYCFEVEHTTDVQRSLNRLYQLQHLYVKFFIIAPEDKKSKFEIEMSKLPYKKIKHRYTFIPYKELEELVECAIPFYELKTKLLGET